MQPQPCLALQLALLLMLATRGEGFPNWEQTEEGYCELLNQRYLETKQNFQDITYCQLSEDAQILYYLVSKDHTLTFYEAHPSCEIVGGRIVWIENMFEFELGRNFSSTAGVVWTGVVREDNQTCPSPFISLYKGETTIVTAEKPSLWGTGEPNCDPGNDGNEPCVEMNPVLYPGLIALNDEICTRPDSAAFCRMEVSNLQGPSPSPTPTMQPPASGCNGHGQMTCTCDRGYTGDSCEIEIDWCEQRLTGFSNATTYGELCEPHGNCTSEPSGATCVCDYGFEGKFCQEEIPGERVISDRCGLKATPKIIAAKIPTSCPGGQHCLPDNLDCFYLPCDYPTGWCLPTYKFSLKLKEALVKHLKNDQA